MKHFRAAQPLSDDDFAEIRSAVMTSIAVRERRQPLLFVMRLAFAIVAIAMMTLMWPRQRETVRPIVTTKAVVIPAQPVLVAERRPEAAGPAGRRPALHKAHHEHHAAEQVAVRLELQTADPEVRIIWITN